jgi:hypothetical protein
MGNYPLSICIFSVALNLSATYQVTYPDSSDRMTLSLPPDPRKSVIPPVSLSLASLCEMEEIFRVGATSDDGAGGV